MTTTTTTTTTTLQPLSWSTRSRFAHSPVWAVCIGSAVVGAVALVAYGAIAEALSVPMRAGEIGASHATALTPASFAIGVASCMIPGTVLALAVARWAHQPARTFLRVAVTLVVFSLVFPLAASHAAVSTRLTLALAHLVAAAIIVPPITRRLAVVRRSGPS